MSSDQRGVIHVGWAIGPDISSVEEEPKKKKEKKGRGGILKRKGAGGRGGIDHAIIGNATIGAAAPINPDASIQPPSITEFRRVWK